MQKTATPLLHHRVFYPIVSNLSELELFIELGYEWIQLRNKQADASFLRNAAWIVKTHRRQAAQKIILNDNIDAALNYHFDGVHLGQEDLASLSGKLTTLRQRQLLLGISTHTHQEIDRALGFSPSYLAIGPLFSSPTKPELKRQSQGDQDAMLKHARKLSQVAIVAIGGIDSTNIAATVARGFDRVAFIQWTKEIARTRTNAKELANQVCSVQKEQLATL